MADTSNRDGRDDVVGDAADVATVPGDTSPEAATDAAGVSPEIATEPEAETDVASESAASDAFTEDAEGERSDAPSAVGAAGEAEPNSETETDGEAETGGETETDAADGTDSSVEVPVSPDPDLHVALDDESARGGTESDAGIEPLTDDDADFRKPAAELKAIVEALIFASPDPLTPKALCKLLDSEPKEDVLAALDALKAQYEAPGGLQLVEVAGGFQIVTRADLHEWVRRLFHERSTQKLSVQALESLAVIAYRQPITAIEITEIRGVNTSGVLNTLLERHLVKIVGRKQVVGRPFMYATTKEFLIRFGLKDLTDLPKVEDMAESLGIESRLLVEQTPPEEQLPLTEPDSEDEADAEMPEDALGVADDSAPESLDSASDSPDSGPDDDPEPLLD